MENNFIKPKTLDELLEVINLNKCRIIAGGTDLLVLMHQGNKIDKILVDISTLQELKDITFQNDTLYIGTGCTHNEIEKNFLANQYAPILSKGCSMVGSTLIRNRGTIGGNVANNSTCGDTIPPLLILDSQIVLRSINNTRRIYLKDFFLDKEKLDLAANEIITGFEINILKDYKWRLFKVSRRKSLAISRLTLGIAFKEKNGLIEDIRICPGAMLPKHQRLWNTEDKFKGKYLNDNIKLIAEESVKEAINLSGIRWSTEYKEPVLKGLIIRTLEEMRDEL